MNTSKLLSSLSRYIFASFFLLLLGSHTVQAQLPSTKNIDADDVATQSSELVGDELTKRIQKVLEEKRDQVKGALDSLLADKRAMIGEVQRVTDDAITIEHQGGTTIIPLSSQVSLLKNNKDIKVDEIAVGNWATILGNKERNTIEPEYVLISTQSLLPKSQVVLLGPITKITRSSLTIQPRGEDEAKIITITRNTEIQTTDGETAAIDELTTDLTILVSGFITDTGIEASTIRSLAPLN